MASLTRKDTSTTDKNVKEHMLEKSDHKRDRIYGKDMMGLNNVRYDGETKKFSYNRVIRDSIDDIEGSRILFGDKKRVMPWVYIVSIIVVLAILLPISLPFLLAQFMMQ